MPCSVKVAREVLAFLDLGRYQAGQLIERKDMCCNCPDFVDLCFICKYVTPAKAYGFYVDDTYCEHLQKHYGHEKATWDDQMLDVDED